MNTYRVFIGLGSNLGDRSAHLNKAAQLLGTLAGSRIVWLSSVYETEPFGNPDQGMFLNAVVELETTLTPPEMFKGLQEIEHTVGRTPSERWGPREIDLDILLYDGLVYADEEIQVPHPGLADRRFVLVPLQEIAADLVHPVNGMTVDEMVHRCAVRGRVVKSPYHIVA
jgi:2-amino-4-hydroxy-6-hydroxymethyldihydropteridine diphosphokinase